MRAATETQIPFAASPLGGGNEKVLGDVLAPIGTFRLAI